VADMLVWNTTGVLAGLRSGMASVEFTAFQQSVRM
jgi:hypothetical protein